MENGNFERQISRELGNIEARLINIEKDTKCLSLKLDSLKDSVEKRVSKLSAKVYGILGGIAVISIIVDLFIRKALAE